MYASTTPDTRKPKMPAKASTPALPGPASGSSLRPALATVAGPATEAVPNYLLPLAHAYVALSDWLLPLFDSITYFVNSFENIIFGPDTRPVQAGDAILLTGAGSGIGHDAALTLARKGIVVYAGVRKPEDVPRLASVGIPTLFPLLLDVTNPASIQWAKQLVQQDLRTRSRNPKLTGIVNVAGIIVSTSMEAATMDDIQKVYNVNAFGPLHVTQAFLPLMREHGSGGRIVLRAAEGIFEGLRQELAHEGICVAIVRPGGVSTEIGSKVEADPSKGQSFAKFAELLMKHIGIPPRNITRHISHALTAQFPLVTYLGGLDGRFIWLARTILPERVFDLVMIRVMLGHW